MIAQIYLGFIKKWNSPSIKKDNPGVNLPDLNITPVYRSDSSGTTYNFTDFLSKTSPAWKSRVGNSTSVNWPTGIGARGSAGVAGVVSRTEGGVMYADVAYALANKLKFAKVKNKAGKWTLPGLRSINAAASSVEKVTGNGEISIVNPAKSQPLAYPISTFTYVLAPTASSKAAELRKFIYWAITSGQKFGPPLLFAPLPKSVLAFDYKQIKKIQASTSVTTTTHDQAPEGLEGGRLPWRVGDIVFYGLTAAAAASTLGLVVWLSVKVVAQAWGAIEEFGLSFIWTVAWDPVAQSFGALDFIYGTVVTSFIALAIATPMSIAIALFLTDLAPRWIRGPIGTLIELLAAIPSVILGLWGILVFGPWVAEHLEPWLNKWFGFLPMFDGQPSQAGLLPAALVLTIMIIPITSSICRELFSRVPRDLSDGALALGATRWETIRGVTIPYAGPGIVAAVLLGLGRAFGEAIAVTQVIGAGSGIPQSWFEPADTLASRIASQYQGAVSGLQIDSILYLAAILLVISLITNVAAQAVVRRFERSRGAIS